MLLSLASTFLSAWLSGAVVLLACWIIQTHVRNAVLGDLGWCLALVGVVGFYAWISPGDLMRRSLVAFLAAVWVLRLASHLLFDRILGKPEDARYRRLREAWGRRAQGFLFLLFQGQALTVAIFSLPMLILMQNTRQAWSAWEAAGIILWLIAFLGEWSADRQLTRFRADPRNRGKTCREGWWRYSRHPNYFFEWLHWWVYVLMGVGVSGWWITLVGPILMLLFLLSVSGIPPAEAEAVASRGDDYRAYQRTTSAFFPWPPGNE